MVHDRSGFIDVRDAQLFVNGGSPNDLTVVTHDAQPESTIDARGARVRDPVLPTFFAENVLGDPTPNSPDLTFASGGLRLVQLSSSQLQAEWTILNQGPHEVLAGTRIRFVRSTDTQLDAADVELGTITVPTTLPGRSGRATGSEVFTVPVDELFYVVAEVDPDDDIEELDEQNNVTAARRPLPDLVFGGQPEIVMLSDTDAQMDWTVHNIGELEAPAGVEARFYRSDDDVLDATDTLLDTVTLPDPLPAAASVGGTQVFGGLPADGLFFVFAVVDPNDDVVELGEDNNQARVGVGPDVTIAQVVVHYSASEEKFLITARILNDGLRAAVGPIETRFTAYPLPFSPTVLGSLTFEGLAAGALQVETAEFPFANPFTGEEPTPPFWLMGAVTDAAGAIDEIDEANNGSTLVGVHWIP